MYSHDEHAAALASISASTTTLEHVRSRIAVLRGDLHVDDETATREAREHLRAAALLLVRAMKACDEAVEALPTPAARPSYPKAFDALHEGHR